MSHTTRTSLIAAALAGAVLVPSAAQADGTPTTLATEQAPTRVAAWESTVMWSRLDPASGRYALLKSVAGGAPTPVTVPERAGGPFDIDLGTNRSGSAFAVYSRDGDIYRLNLASGAETKVAKLSSPKLAERNPTIQRGRIAFIRRSGRFDELRIGDTTTGSKGSSLVVRRGSISYAELGNRQIAYVTSFSTPKSAGGEAQLRIRNLSTGSDKLAYRARSGGANIASITRPSFVAKPEGFLFARTNIGSGSGNRLIRYTLYGAKLDYAAGQSNYISTAWAGATLGAVVTSAIGGSESAQSTSPGACNDAGVAYCTVVLTGPLSFGLKP
jgi:hypothetical protein